MTALYDQPNRSLQDYDVPPSHRNSSSRRPSYDALRNFVGSRKTSLGDDIYDTPPSSKRGSTETADIIYDTPISSKRTSCERTPPHSNRSSASRDSGLNLLSSSSQLSLYLQQSGDGHPSVIRRRSGSHSSQSYNEASCSSNRSSLERILCEEGPPIYESLSPATSIEQLNCDDPTYDTPPSRSHVLSRINPASQSSLISAPSSESLLSNRSSIGSAHMSRTVSLPDSARSSMDLPSDIYDVPSRGQESDRSRKQLSMDSGLGFYDSPVRSRPSSSTSNTVILDNLKLSHSSFDCKTSPPTKDIKRSKSLENAVDDLYDTPRNNAPKVNHKKLEGIKNSGSSSMLSESSSVYDIPPQVTRDSVISMGSDCSDENQRLSSYTLDDDPQMAEVLQWDELLVDVDSALELLVKRQQDVLKATSRLTSFVNNTWRSQSSLEKTLYDIKISCTLVRSSLLDFLEFGHGALANAARQPDKQLTWQLYKCISPLDNSFQLVNKSFINLEEMKWQVSLLSEPSDKNRFDDLGQIALVARELMPDVRKVVSCIQSNGSTLFKRSTVADVKRPPMFSKPPVVPKSSDNSVGKYSVICKPKNMQQRPLPAVPVTDKALLITATQPVLDTRKLSLYDIKAALHKDDYAECDELPSEKDAEQTQKLPIEQNIQEYDYVQLDSRDSLSITKSLSKNTEPGTDSGDRLSKCESRNTEQTGGSYNMFDEDKVDSKIPTKDIQFTDITPAENVASVNNDDVELVLVKEGGSDNIQDTSQIEMKLSEASLHQTDASTEDTSDLDLTDQDFKTPVNVSSCNSDFIFPPPETVDVVKEQESLNPNDRQVLVFYSEQLNSHSTLLANAIDAFIGVVSSKEPPNVFISHSKFVIVSAHKLVHIGDSIHRNLISNTVSMQIMQCANHLCDCLKASVLATKTAALQYPCAPAVQEMVDKVVAVSHAAHELKLVITLAAKQ